MAIARDVKEEQMSKPTEPAAVPSRNDVPREPLAWLYRNPNWPSDKAAFVQLIRATLREDRTWLEIPLYAADQEQTEPVATQVKPDVSQEGQTGRKNTAPEPAPAAGQVVSIPGKSADQSMVDQPCVAAAPQDYSQVPMGSVGASYGLNPGAPAAGHGSCWFIERMADHSQPPRPYKRWLQSFSHENPVWTNNPLSAIRFCREQDAKSLCKHFGIPTLQRYAPFATEHVFLVTHAPAAGHEVTFKTSELRRKLPNSIIGGHDDSVPTEAQVEPAGSMRNLVPAAAPDLCDKILSDMPPYYGETVGVAAPDSRVTLSAGQIADFEIIWEKIGRSLMVGTAVSRQALAAIDLCDRVGALEICMSHDADKLKAFDKLQSEVEHWREWAKCAQKLYHDETGKDLQSEAK